MKLGRKPRSFDARIPKLSATVTTLPSSVNYGAALPSNTGAYFNDSLGDCVEAAVYHALQVWSANANPPMDSEPQNDAVLLYEKSSGYVPGNPDTDQGSNEQVVLSYWLKSGVPCGANGATSRLLTAYVEIDQTNLTAVKQAILEGGLAYIGINVPAYVDLNATVWNVNPSGDQSSVGGHAVILVGYDDRNQMFDFISWGEKYQMSYTFFSSVTDEAYMLADSLWIKTTGNTPFGMTLSDLESAMQALKYDAPSGDRRQHRRKKRRRAA